MHTEKVKLGLLITKTWSSKLYQSNDEILADDGNKQIRWKEHFEQLGMLSADAYNDLTILTQLFKSSNGEQTPKFLLSKICYKIKTDVTQDIDGIATELL